MRTLLYYIFKFFIKTGLFFYTKEIKILGKDNIPKKEAILFTSNHPNGLIDPLLIASNISRKSHFLVRAAVFKKKTIAYFFDLLGMMPIYRIRDGVKQLSKNEEIFNKCEELLKNKKALLIFPEGSHNRKRTIRPLSKGFTRIIFRTLDESPETNIHIVPIGITYQNASNYPSKVAINIGKPILANTYYKKENINSSVKEIKNLVSKQLESLSVHLKDDDKYNEKLSKLNFSQVDFTDVNKVNSMIKNEKIQENKSIKKNYLKPIFYLILINSIIPYTIWRLLSKKISEIEFIDTFRFGVNTILFPIFYILQSWVISLFFGFKVALIYFITSIFLVLFYTKTVATPAE